MDNMDNMDIVDILYRDVYRNNIHYGMCCSNIFLTNLINEYEKRRNNMDYIDLKLEEIILCSKVYKKLGREKFIKLYEEYIKNEDKTTETSAHSQEAKADSGKPKLTLVPDQIIYDIAEVREYGNRKYGDSNNWKTVEIERYRDAAFCHFLAYIREPNGKDEESGIEHLKHLACNIAFLCALEKNKKED